MFLRLSYYVKQIRHLKMINFTYCRSSERRNGTGHGMVFDIAALVEVLNQTPKQNVNFK